MDHTLLFITKASPLCYCPKTLGRMSNSNEGCLHGFICHPSPVIRALSLLGAGMMEERQASPSFLGNTPLDNEQHRKGSLGMKETNLNAIPLNRNQ